MSKNTMVDYKLFGIVLVAIILMTLITFLMKSTLIEIMLPLLMATMGLFALYVLFTSFRSEK